MSVALSGDHTVTATGVATIPPLSAELALMGQDAWVELAPSPTDLREVVRAVVVALKGHAAEGDLLRIRQGDLVEASTALARVCSSDAVQAALTWRLSQADADELGARLQDLSTTPDTCEHPRGCWNAVRPTATRCDLHDGE